MDGQDEPTAATETIESSASVAESAIDLVGGPFAVIESDPGVFSSLTRLLGVKRAELVELYDIEPWAVDHLDPYGLIFCFTWQTDNHRPTDFDDPAAEKVWFANQLSDDACATHAILNVLFNCPELELGEELRDFREETKLFSPVMRGLAISSSPLLRRVHNFLARPADLRASLNAAAIKTLKAQKSKTSKGKGKAAAATKDTPIDEDNPPYHFIGYVPAFGKVWELDGLKSGPLEVGELSSEDSTKGWMDVVRPALRLKMAKYGGSGSDGSNICFSLLAVVQDMKVKFIDELEFLKKDKQTFERLLEDGWENMLEPALLQMARDVFDYELPEDYQHPGGFASRRMQRDIELMEIPQKSLLPMYENLIRDASRAKTALGDEVEKRRQAEAEHTKRTFDYEPFFKEFVVRLHKEGLLYPILDLDECGKKIKAPSKKKRTV